LDEPVYDLHALEVAGSCHNLKKRTVKGQCALELCKIGDGRLARGPPSGVAVGWLPLRYQCQFSASVRQHHAGDNRGDIEVHLTPARVVGPSGILRRHGGIARLAAASQRNEGERADEFPCTETSLPSLSHGSPFELPQYVLGSSGSRPVA
jgi:hypothetical protein